MPVRSLKCLRIVAAAGEDKAAGFGAEILGILEQGRIVALDQLESLAQLCLELCRIRKARQS